MGGGGGGQLITCTFGLGNEARAHIHAAALLGSFRVGWLWSELIGDEDGSNNRSRIDSAPARPCLYRNSSIQVASATQAAMTRFRSTVNCVHVTDSDLIQCCIFNVH